MPGYHIPGVLALSRHTPVPSREAFELINSSPTGINHPIAQKYGVSRRTIHYKSFITSLSTETVELQVVLGRTMTPSNGTCKNSRSREPTSSSPLRALCLQPYPCSLSESLNHEFKPYLYIKAAKHEWQNSANLVYCSWNSRVSWPGVGWVVIPKGVLESNSLH